MSRHGRDASPAAITGIGCRLPGDIHSPGLLWTALTEGRDTVTRIPERRWEEMSAHLAPEQRPETPWPAGVLADPDAFDAGFFAVPALEAAHMDPQQRMLLETTVEALADAGIPPTSLAGRRVGVYVGSASFDQATLGFAPGREVGMHTAGGTGMAILANRLSYCLDLRGPSLTVDTACSSSLVAAHYARRDLESGEVELAIVAGANVLLNPAITAAFVHGGVLAPDGRCKPFDAAADGYVRSEGVGVAVLKPLDTARADSDRIYATLVGSAITSDGHSKGLYAPTQESQEEALRRACDTAGVAPREVDYVQAHGTGTKAGDRTEAHALARVLGQGRDPSDPLLVGSVKSNMGHLEGAAGITSLITAALALRHGRIPSTPHHTRTRAAIARLPLRVPTTVEPWPHRHRPRTAGVSAFGFGGTNVHTVLRAAPEPRTDPAVEGPVLIPVSTHTAATLAGTAADWAGHLSTESCDTADAAVRLATTAAHRRDHHAHRAAVVATTTAEARAGLTALAEGRPHPAVAGPRVVEASPPRVVFVFSGHGGHWDGMGTRPAERLSAFRAEIERARAALAPLLGGATPWQPGETIDGFATAQHATFTLQLALARTLRDQGIVPDAVVGHSLGEIAAATVAGALSPDDAARVLVARSSLLEDAAPTGGLLATALTAERAEELVADHGGGLAVAVRGAPESTVVSGPTAELERLHARLADEGVWARRVLDDTPAHSPLLEPLLSGFTAEVGEVAPQAATCGFVSTATGDHLPGERLDAGYWTRQLRRPVLFHEAVRVLAAERPTLFVEIAPRATTAHALTEILTTHGLEGSVVLAAQDGGDEYTHLLHTFGRLYTHGHTPVWPVPAGLPPADLPPPRWHRTDTDPTGGRLAALTECLGEAATPRERRTVVAELLGILISETTRSPVPEPDTDYARIGLSSIAVVELTTRLRGTHPAWADLTVPTVLHLESPRALADHLAGLLDGAPPSRVSVPEPPATPVPDAPR